MPKYRLLNLNELQNLEKEFIEFLILNGIVAEDWETIKRDTPEKAGEIIDLFSDVVFESIMRKTRFLESSGEKEILAIQCLEEKMVLVGMRADQDSDVNFQAAGFIENALSAPPKGLKVFTKEKPYSKQRELEIFELTESGFVISEGRLFKAICLAL